MFNRQKFFFSYQQQFTKDYKKSLEGFGADERIHVIDTLIALIECYKEEPVNYPKVQQINEQLYKKYRKRLVNYSNLSLSEYFAEESIKHLDLQFNLKVETSGSSDNFFTEKERKDFLTSIEMYLKNDKRMLYLQMEPSNQDDDKEPGETGIQTKAKNRYKQKDTVSKLSQEQTALLIYFLQKAGIIRGEQSLNNTEAGEAFEILTGYSAHTLRQSLNKEELKKIASRKNLKMVSDTLTHANNLLDSAIKTRKDSAEPS